ncbi:uncharacterized protein LOC128232215 [Mya arenaria]|uniref:uncharacterized protein LOC128232215 n=1 Tax=Mya arenaria TaxID=6604 RepID=UPI0022E4D5B0|nr:uncharacterized protein LOC128232215 [Mya arenaria]
MATTEDYLFNNNEDQVFDISVLLNLSKSDIDTILSENGSKVDDGGSVPKDTSNVDVHAWLFALNVVSGCGVLTNTLFTLLIIVDFIVDKSRLVLTRHWLLLNMSLTTVAYLGIGIYLREFGPAFSEEDRPCIVLQHTEKTIEFVMILYLLVIAINILCCVVRPSSPCGKRNILFWIVFILFVMVCANLAVMALYTIKLDSARFHDGERSCVIDTTLLLSSRDIQLTSITTFYVPYGIVLIVALTTLVCLFIQQTRLARASPDVNDESRAKKFAAIFLFITTTTGFLLMLPFFVFQIPEILVIFVMGLKINFHPIYFMSVILKLLFYMILPILCFILQEVREIYHKIIR